MKLLKIYFALAWLALGGWHGNAAEPITHLPTPREFQMLVLLVDFQDPEVAAVWFPHRSWQTTEFVRNAIGQVGFAPTVTPGGARAATGSIKDMVERLVPGLVFRPTLYEYPASHGTALSDGWYQYQRGPGEVIYDANGDPDFALLRQSLFRQLEEKDPGFTARVDGAGRTYQGVLLLTGGPRRFAGAGRDLFTIANFLNETRDEGSDRIARYNFLGLILHEALHAAAGYGDHYNDFFGGDSAWDIMASGDGLGAFPAPLAAWASHMWMQGRRETRFRKGESGEVRLKAPGIEPGVLELAALDNSSVGSADRLIVEYRDGSGRRYDSANYGVAAGNPNGLLIADLDLQARGLFYSHLVKDGTLMSNIVRQPSEPEITDGVRTLTRTVEIKRQDGARGDMNDLFGLGMPFVSQQPSAGMIGHHRSSANRDGDVLWQILPFGETTEYFEFRAAFQGTPLTLDALDARSNWRSAGGIEMSGGPTPVPQNGWYYEENRNLWFYTAGPPGATSAEGVFPHTVHRNGERLTFRMQYGETTPDTFLFQMFVEGTLVLMASNPNGGSEYSVDLSGWAGQTVTIRIVAHANAQAGLGLIDAYFYRKGEGILYDFVQRRPYREMIETVGDPNGNVGRIDNVKLEDGVQYSTAIFAQPQSRPSGKAVIRSPRLRIPSNGAILRGTVGYSDAAARALVSDGATIQIAVDDGRRRLPIDLIGEGGGRTWIGYGQGPLAWLISQEVERDLAVNGNFALPGKDPNLIWRAGDWMRSGDANGDGMDDIIVFTEENRVLVSLSQRRSLLPQQVWAEGWESWPHRPLCGNLNLEERTHERADILVLTDDGDVYVSLAFEGRFNPVRELWGRDMAYAQDVGLLGDLNGDRLDDLVIFAGPGTPRREGSVWVAYNAGGVRFAPPVMALESFFGSDDIPLVGDLNNDRRADLLALRSGSASVALSPPAGGTYVAEGWAIDGGPQFRSVLAREAPQRYPGSRPVEGPIPFLAHELGEAYLVWVTRSQPVGAGQDKSQVWSSRANPSQRIFEARQMRHGQFGADEQWPLVGNFDGDLLLDVAITQPLTRLGEHRQFYVSPKPADLSFIPYSPYTSQPRLNRFVLDLTRFAGRVAQVEATVNAGPLSAIGDDVYWPDFKIYADYTPPPFPFLSGDLIARSVIGLNPQTLNIRTRGDVTFGPVIGQTITLGGSVPNTVGSFVIDQATEFPIRRFITSFSLRVPGSFAEPGPAMEGGFSFNFGVAPEDAFGELGTGNGLTITFDQGGVKGESIQARWDGAVIAEYPTPIATDDESAPVEIHLDGDGTLDVLFAGMRIFDNLPTPFAPREGARFSFGARAQDQGKGYEISELRIEASGDNALPPTIQCPQNLRVVACPEVTGHGVTTKAQVNYGVTATALCGQIASLTFDPPDGSILAPGIYQVTARAVDTCGSSTKCVFEVSVVEEPSAPQIVCAPDKTVELGSAWRLDAPRATDVCDGEALPMRVDLRTNNICGLSEAIVATWTATNSRGKQATCSQTITVRDTTAPVVRCIGDKTFTAESPQGLIVEFESNATDAGDPNIRVVCDPPSGSLFAIGVTRVTCAASDPCGNRAVCEFTVTILPPAPVNASLSGMFDILGVSEIFEENNYSQVMVTGGPNEIARSVTLSGSPASGSFSFENLTPSDQATPAAAYRVSAQAKFENAFSLAAWPEPVVWPDPIVWPEPVVRVRQTFHSAAREMILQAGLNDLGALFEINPGRISGLVTLEGFEEAMDSVSIEMDAEAMDQAGAGYFGGTATVFVAPRFELAARGFGSPFEVLAGQPGGGESMWRLARSRIDIICLGAELSEDYVSTRLSINELRPESLGVAPETRVTVNREYKFGRVVMFLRAPVGKIFGAEVVPGSRGVFPLPGVDPVPSREIVVERGLGTPLTQADAGDFAKVVLLATEGRYTLNVRAKILEAGGVITDREVAQFADVDVAADATVNLPATGCGQVRSCPQDMNVACQTPGGAAVNFALPTGVDLCTGEALVWECSPSSGSLFPIGKTKVTCVARTATGEAARCEFFVIVSGGCRPELRIASTRETIILAWPATAGGFGLQRALDLARTPVEWLPIDAAEIRRVGEEFQLELPQDGPGAYFRLASQ